MAAKSEEKKRRQGHLANASVRRVRGIRSRLDDLYISGGKFYVVVGEPLRADLTRTMEGASSLEIDLHDPDGEFLRSKLLKRRVDVKLDGLHFRLVQVRRTGTTLTLVFEDRAVAFLRLIDKPRKAYRGAVTRAEFVLSQVREVKRDRERIPVYIPELHKVQPIASAADDRTAQQTTVDTRGQGLDRDANLEVKGVAANSEQITNGETVLRVGASLGAPRNALLASIMAGTQENNMTNSTNDGYFAITDSTAAATGLNRSDLAACANSFYKDGFGGGKGAIDYANEGQSPGDICANCENPYGPYRGLYAQWQPQAEKWLAAFEGGGITGVSTTTTQSREKQYAFERKKGEDAWDSIQRLAEEVHYRAFMSAGVFYYVSEEYLFQSKPLMYLGQDTDGVDPPDFDWDMGKKIAEVSLAGEIAHWAAPPGTAIKLNDDFGPATGKYIISEISSSLFNDQFTATAKTPTKALPEPAPETVERQTSTGESGNFAADSGGGQAGSLEGVEIRSYEPGDPAWGGTSYFFYQLIDDICTSGGCSIGGRKETGHQVGGDHDPNSVTSFATDYPTYSGQGVAEDVAAALGVSYAPNNWNLDTFSYDGHTWRTQILWRAPDGTHTDHVHVGIRRS